MTDQPLSPAAAAVLDATYREMDYAPRRHLQWAAAAALRAAADQVVPEPSAHLPEQNCRWYRLGVSAYRHNLLAIAAELDAQ
jgi:hypothetical protein